VNSTAPGRAGAGGLRFVVGYSGLAIVAGGAIAVALLSGSGETSATAIAGHYMVVKGGPCLGSGNTDLVLEQSGQFIAATTLSGRSHLRLEGGRLDGDVLCADGALGALQADISKMPRKPLLLRGQVSNAPFSAIQLPSSNVGPAMVKQRSNEETFGRLMLAMAVVILAARLVGALTRRLAQPQVMGEVLAGILLGPTLLGAVAPTVEVYLFPSDIIPILGGAADIGLALFMFLVGLELDLRALGGRAREASFISNASVAVPLALGTAVAVPLFPLLGPPTKFLPFALFMGVAMSITAFPVLVRILLERRMLKTPIGVITTAAAAVDDVTAWGLLALATAVAGNAAGLSSLRVIGLAGAFCVAMVAIGRPLLSRLSTAYDEAGHVPAGWIATIFVSVLISAFVAQQIGIAAIFGAFMMGLIMPRRADLSHEVSDRLESFVVTVLLPLFFVVVGLKTQIGLLDQPVLWALTALLLGVAIVGKWGGAMLATTVGGYSARQGAVIATLMNTRGLTELIILNIALDKHAITQALFTMLVVMALVTTFMAGPTLRLLDPKRRFSAPAEDDLRQAERVTAPQLGAPVPSRAILVASQEDKRLDALIAIAALLAAFQPRREIILVRLIEPSRLATGLSGYERDLRMASAELARRRQALIDREVAARAVAFTSGDTGADLVRLASEHEVDLVLLEGRRPLLGDGIPRGEVGFVLEQAPSDVAVLVGRDGTQAGSDQRREVIVPFGGAEHDWAALELGSWIASVRGVSLRILGAKGDIGGVGDAIRLLADASLLVQRFTWIAAEPLLVDRGREGILRAAETAGLLVVGLSERWRKEGLGAARLAIARRAPAPTLFVRRGTRPGALAPAGDVTRFAWSTVGPPPVGSGAST